MLITGNPAYFELQTEYITGMLPGVYMEEIIGRASEYSAFWWS
jgi:hypothetical protein